MFSAYRAAVVMLPENEKNDCIILQPWLSFNGYTFLTVYFSDPTLCKSCSDFSPVYSVSITNIGEKEIPLICRNLKLFFQRILELNLKAVCQFIERCVLSAVQGA